jgi:hypothetical protein
MGLDETHGCNVTKLQSGSCAYRDREACRNVVKNLRMWLPDLFKCLVDPADPESRKNAQHAANAFVCVPQRESMYNKCCVNYQGQDPTDLPKGLFQMGVKDFYNCNTSQFCLLYYRPFCKSESCQALTAANKAISLCMRGKNHNPVRDNFYKAVNPYWQVMQSGKYGYGDWINCMRDEGTSLTDLEKIKCPVACCTDPCKE